MTATPTLQRVLGPAGAIAVRVRGDVGAPVVAMTHSILTSGAMWDAQAERLVAVGLRVLCVDARGHGGSDAGSGPCTMDDLADDTVAVLDALGVERAHHVGLSLGGMSGFALARRHGARLASLVACSARADAPPAVAAPWDERIALAEREGTAALAAPTLERWFGRPFLSAHPDVEARLRALVGATSVAGFVACARAIQGLDEMAAVAHLALPTTFIVGANDGALPQAARELHALVPGSVLEVIERAGHLPNLDRPDAFDAALMRHVGRVAARR